MQFESYTRHTVTEALIKIGESQFDLHRRAKTKIHAAQHDTKNAFRAELRV